MRCPYCNQEHSDTDKFCLVTGRSLAPPPASKPKPARRRLKILPLILLPLLLLAALLTGLVFALRACVTQDAEPAPTPTLVGADGIRPEDATPEPELPLSTLPSPLAGLDFPTEPIAYPPDWPAELLFPAEFLLVQASSGSLEADSPTGWSAGLRFPGDVDQALKQLTLFFTDHGWTVEANPMASGATLLLIEKNDGESQGLLVIAAAEDDPAQAQVLVTIFP